MTDAMTYDAGSAALVFALAMVPLIAAASCALPITRRIGPLLAAFAAVPALASAALLPDVAGEIAWLGTGVHVALDATSRAFLGLAGIIWTAAGLYALGTVETRRPRIFGFFALAMAGNLGLTVAVDPASFYALFSMMALSTYALVAHGPVRAEEDSSERAVDARRSGRTYMVFTVTGEAILLSGLFVLVMGGVALVPLAAVLVLVAFGIKVGTPGVHGWMPVAYAAAPPAAAAALAGSMSTSGILGVVRFAPGGADLPLGIGVAVMGFGLFAAFAGAFVGVVQREPSAVLAYSSVSQFGLITITIGAGLTSPDLWPLTVVAATVYAVHHGLAKAALFLGGDVATRMTRRGWSIALTALPALALAGVPLTSGSVAKIVLKEVTAEAPAPWHTALDALLPVAAVGTTLLMVRFCYLLWRSPQPAEGARRAPTVGVTAWIALLAAVAAVIWVWPADDVVRYAAEKSFTMQYLWLATWPAVAGIVVTAAVWAGRAWAGRFEGMFAPGDIYAPLFARMHGFVEQRDERVSGAAAPASPAAPRAEEPPSVAAGLLARAGAWESGLLAWATATSAIAALTALLLLLAARG